MNCTMLGLTSTMQYWNIEKKNIIYRKPDVNSLENCKQ